MGMWVAQIGFHGTTVKVICESVCQRIVKGHPPVFKGEIKS